MVVEKAVSVAGRGAGSFLGGIFNNPGVVIVAGIGLALFIFKDKIGDFFGGIAEGFKFPEINLPDITFPEFNFPEFPEIVIPPLPTLDDFPSLCSLFGIGCPTDLDTELPPPPPTAIVQEVTELCNENCQIVQDAQGGVTIQCECDGEIFSGSQPPPDDLISSLPPPPPDPVLPPIIIDPELDLDPEDFAGGGPSFIGGSIGQTPITTLFQVLDLFPGLSASGASNFLFQFSGILPSEAIDLDQFKQFQ